MHLRESAVKAASQRVAWDQAVRTARSNTLQRFSLIYENVCVALRCPDPLDSIGTAQGEFWLVPKGTADLCLEEFAALALCFMCKT